MPAGLDDPYAYADKAYKERQFAELPAEYQTEKGTGDNGTSYGTYGLTQADWNSCFAAEDVQVQYIKDEVLFPDTDEHLVTGEPQWLVMNKLKYNLLVTRLS